MLLLTSSFYALYYDHESKERTTETLELTKHMQKMFEETEKQDIKTLASSLDVILQDKGLKGIYLEKNRTKLYDYGQLLFQGLKTRYGITHFYFILPNGTTFVRLHDKEIYGDEIKRFTFLASRDTKGQGEGIELGKTAFALRVVRLYYNDDEVIGYVELGEEIGHFMKILKTQTGNDFAVVIKKQYLSREDWKSVRETAGLRNNWDDLADYIVISASSEDEICINSENAGEVMDKGIFTKTKNLKKEGYACGGFPLIDAGNRTAGAILSTIDFRENRMHKEEFNSRLISFLIMGFALCVILTLLLSKTILKPIVLLRDYTIEIGKGNLDVKLPVKSNDEIGDLLISFNKMAVDLKISRKIIEDNNKNLEKKVEERTKELKRKNEELERFNKITVGRELKMIELKKNIRELEGKQQRK